MTTEGQGAGGDRNLSSKLPPMKQDNTAKTVKVVKAVGERIQLFRMRFRALFAVLLSSGAGLFLYKACFTAEAELTKHTGIVVGFITGSILSAIVMFYFGTSEGQQNGTETGGK